MFRSKKIIAAVILVLLMSLIFSGCMYIVSISGIENFNINDSNMSLNQCILPSDDFIEKFEYTNAEYYYYDVNKHPFYVANTEQSIIVFNYEEDVYNEAKIYCLENMELSEVNKFEYNGYTFIENIALFSGRGEAGEGVNTDYPDYFNMFAYNDYECCLVFMGFFDSLADDDNSAYLAETDWGAFLDKYFSQYYDFGTQEEFKSKA